MAEPTGVDWLWSGRGAGARAMRALLSPASAAFSVVVRARNAMYDAGVLRVRTPRLPALSVGNLTVGGTGKTPVSSWLALGLASRGAHPAIVLRGYGADEPLVHARLTPTIPVIASADRLAAIERAACAGADIAVLDDGFQHRRVARAADVVLLSADEPDVRVRLLPAGPYREPATALRRASLVLVTRKAATLARARALASWARAVAPGVPVALVHLSLDAVHVGGAAPASATTLSGRHVLAIAGVANATAFAAQLAQAGAIVRLRAFADHHAFTAGDAVALARDAAANEIALCTLKDAVKLVPLWPREARAIGYVSQAVIVDERADAVDALLDLVVHARFRQP